MQQTGQVIAVENGTATVRIQRCEACEHCGACFRIGEKEADILLHNPVGARVGDYVAIHMRPQNVLLASAIAYGIPLCALLIGVLLGSLWGDVYTALGGVLFPAAAFFLLRALEPRLAKNRTLLPAITRILPPPAIIDAERA
ncbi:MAG: SoxR reducing system RseC family protein [Clostridia bacterium]|nr:SoxR reducing system RseC family protein [Clostridia bacterium]